MDMTQVLSQMGILVFIMVVGFVCAKLGVTGPEFNRRLSGVVMNVLLVFTVLYSVMNTDIEMDLAELGLDSELFRDVYRHVRDRLCHGEAAEARS